MWLWSKGITKLHLLNWKTKVTKHTDSPCAGRFPESPSVPSKNTHFIFTSSFTLLFQLCKYSMCHFSSESDWNTHISIITVPTTSVFSWFTRLPMVVFVPPYLSFFFCLFLSFWWKQLIIATGLKICFTYLSLAKTMTSLKRNRCLSVVFVPSVTWTHSSSSRSPFSLVRPRTNGLCSTDTQQEASSLRTHTDTHTVGGWQGPPTWPG